MGNMGITWMREILVATMFVILMIEIMTRKRVQRRNRVIRSI